MGFVDKHTGGSFSAVTQAPKQLVKAVQNAPGISTLSKAATDVFQPIEKAVVQPVSAGLASFDKAVGKAIPGGWGTVGMAAASMIPGMQPLTMAGLGALNGSGVLRKGGSFNLQGAMMGGAMAYGMSSLAQYAQGAVPTEITPTVDSYGNLVTPVPDVTSGVTPPTDAISSLNASQGWTGAGASAPSTIPTSAINAANVANPALLQSTDTAALNALTKSMEAGAGTGLQVAPQPSIMSNIMGGNFGYAADQIGTGISNSATGAYDSLANSASSAYDSLANLGEKAITPSTYTNAATSYGENVAKTGEGIKNLLGAGEMTGAQAAKLATANAAAQGLTSPVMAAGATLYGGMGLAALDEQRKYLEESKAANAISQAEYDSAVAEIDRSVDVARKAVADNPFNDNPDRSYTPTPTTYEKTNENDNLYARLTGQEKPYESGSSRLYAAGGSIDDEYGFDEARGVSVGNMSNGFMNSGIKGYAKGGEARLERDFLDMVNAEFKSPPSQYVEGMGFVTPPPSVEGRLGANFDALGGNIRAGASGMAMMGQDKRMMAMPGMMDVGYKAQVGPGNLDVGIQRAMRSAPGRGRDYAANVKYEIPFAEGGQARFLSGGGDGMSDSIKATIGGKQEARLADGEFVIPADVVSHLGNGSSKAGAKQLYSMMDKVRSARTGTKKQGKQINPRKYLAA